MGKVILWPERRVAQHFPNGDIGGYDIAGAAVLDVSDSFSWAGRCVDWEAVAVVEDLSSIRAAQRDRVCELAEAVRSRFITPGAGQALTYARKEIEARAWIAGGDPATSPFLAAEAAAVDMSIDALAQLVIAQADAWVEAGSAIEARRRGLLVAIEEAGSRAALDAIDIATGWPEVSE